MFRLRPPTAICYATMWFFLRKHVAPRVALLQDNWLRFGCVPENWLCCNALFATSVTRDGCFHDRQLVTAHDAAALSMFVEPSSPHVLTHSSGLEPSHTRPTRASSPLTNFPKQDSHHPMHPYPSIPVIRAPRPHAYESIASSHTRHLSPCAHTCTRTP